MVPLQAVQGLLIRNKVQNLFELFQRLFWLQGNEDSIEWGFDELRW